MPSTGMSRSFAVRASAQPEFVLDSAGLAAPVRALFAVQSRLYVLPACKQYAVAKLRDALHRLFVRSQREYYGQTARIRHRVAVAGYHPYAGKFFVVKRSYAYYRLHLSLASPLIPFCVFSLYPAKPPRRSCRRSPLYPVA